MSAPRIGFVASGFPPIGGGVEIYNNEITAALSRAQVEVHVAVRYKHKEPRNGLDAIWRDTEMTKEVFSQGNSPVEVLTVSAWQKQLLRTLPGIVHRYNQHWLARKIFNLAY